MSLRGLSIGELDRRFQFENLVETIDPIGNTRVETYSNAFTIYGKFVTQGGGEVFESNQQTNTQGAQIMVRYTNLITSTMRVKDLMENEYYDIRNVQKKKREGMCVIQAERRDNK
jgi:SPP1 family predicted phage head-tail adaptor